MPNTASSLSGSSPPNPVETLPQHVDVLSPIPPSNKKPAISDVVADCIFYCKEHNINAPIEILQYSKSCIVTGKQLNWYIGNKETLNGESTFILKPSRCPRNCLKRNKQHSKSSVITQSLVLRRKCSGCRRVKKRIL